MGIFGFLKQKATVAPARADLDKQRVEGLIGDLKSKDPKVVLVAAEAIKKMGTVAVEPLIASLQDANPEMRSWAARLLRDIRDERAVQPLIAALNDHEPAVCISAVSALRELQDARAIDPLLLCLENANPKIRGEAASALGHFSTERVSEALLRALSDESRLVRREAAVSLGKLKEPRALEPITRLLQEETDHYTRAGFSEALSMIGRTRNLIEQLQQGDEQTRERAIIGLWKTGDSQAVPPIINALHDPSFGVKVRAIQAFRYLRDDRGVLPLVQVLKTQQSIELKAEAAESLAYLTADEMAIDAIRELLLDTDNADALVKGGIKYHKLINDVLKRLGKLRTVQNPSDLEGIPREIALSLKAWYRDNARSWWQRNKAKQSATCDDGDEPLREGEGFLRPGNHLCCEAHTDLLLCNADWETALKDLDGYFGPGLPDHIKSIARGSDRSV